MKKYLIYFIALGLIFSLLSVNTLKAQEEVEEEIVAEEEEEEIELLESTLAFKIIKQNAGNRILLAEITAETEDGTVPLINTELDFYQVGEEDELIGSAVSNKMGKVEFIVAADHLYLVDEDLLSTIRVAYSGNDSISEILEELSFQDLHISMTAEIVDSIKMIVVEASYLDIDSNEVPLNEEEILVYIEGLYSRLKIGDIWMEEGYGEFEFPDDLPGDVDGNLNIFVSLNEHELFGFVEKMESRQWGTGFEGSDKYKPALWTSQAPLWMIIVLIILLSGVWGHYVYAFLQLRRINRNGKNTEGI